jgi:hypothetical protein
MAGLFSTEAEGGAHSECRRGNGARGSPREIRRRQWDALAWGIISQGLPSEIRQTQWEALAQALFHGARPVKYGGDNGSLGAGHYFTGLAP